MELALNEVKTQAKKLLKALKIDSNLKLSMEIPLKKVGLSLPAEIKLKHCLAIISQQLGFDNWHHAQDILSGSKTNTEALDMGTFFYPRWADGFINEWFSDYQQAKSVLLDNQHDKWLLPYKNQFLVVSNSYVLAFKLDKKLVSLWGDVNHDMVAGYNSLAWDNLTCEIIKNRAKNC